MKRISASITLILLATAAYALPSPSFQTHTDAANPIEQACTGYMYGNASSAVTCATTILLAGPYSAAGTPLPTCNTGTKGKMAYVSDATAPSFRGTYVSGGAVITPVFCDATNWLTI